MNAIAQIPYFKSYNLLKKHTPFQTTSILQDHQGIIWFGTNQGLIRHDGINSIHYKSKDEYITALALDSLDRIWAGHKNGKISYLENGNWKAFEPDEGSASAPISTILFDQEGKLWFSTKGDGIYYFKSNRLYRLDQMDGLPDDYAYHMAIAKNGDVWVGTDRGIAICKNINSKISIETIDQKNGLPDNIVKKIIFNKTNTVWIGTEDAGIFNYDEQTKKFDPIHNKWLLGSLNDFILTDHHLWISTKNKGTVVYNIDNKQETFYNKEKGTENISTFLNDKEGNIWMGHTNGVSRCYGNFVEFIPPNPSSDANVQAVTIAQNGDVWFSTKEGLFIRKTDSNGNISIETPLQKTKFKDKIAISLFTDRYGYIWAGMYGQGVLRINPKTFEITPFFMELDNGIVINITGKENSIWLATLGGATNIIIDSKKFKIKNYNRKDGLISEYIYQIFIDSQNKVWFATDREGVDCLDQNGFKHYKKGLEGKVVYGFTEDQNHTIWANIQGAGLFKFNRTNFIPFSKSSLKDKNITSLSTDQNGDLVVIHDLGIEILSTKNNKIRYLSEDVGIKEIRPNLNAVAKDLQNRLYFGIDGGIIRLSSPPQKLPQAPTPLIQSVYLFDESIDICKELKFNHDDNNITFNYLGLWYQQPENLIFQYQLVPHDRKWITTRNLSAIYSRLSPGDYTFKLRTSISEDFLNAEETTLNISISNPFWQLGWFYVLCFILFIGSGFTFIHLREKHLQYDKNILEEKVKARTLEIQLKNEEIQTQHEEIYQQAEEIKGMNENLEKLVTERTAQLELKNKSLEEYAFINAHQLRSPVASILGLINLVGKMKSLKEESELVVHLKDSADKLDEIVRSITVAIEKSDD